MKFFILILILINIFTTSLSRGRILSLLSLKGSFYSYLLFLLLLFSLWLIDFLLGPSWTFFSPSLLLSCFFSIIASPGIRYDGFNTFMGSTTLIKFFPFDKIKNIEINYSNDSKVVLKIDTFSNSQKLAFDEKDKNKIEN